MKPRRRRTMSCIRVFHALFGRTSRIIFERRCLANSLSPSDNGLPMWVPLSPRGGGPLPLHPAEVPGTENDEAKRNSVPGENLEVVAADIAYHGAHGQRPPHQTSYRTHPNHTK